MIDFLFYFGVFWVVVWVLGTLFDTFEKPPELDELPDYDDRV